MAQKVETADRPSDDPIHVEYLKLALDEARKCEPTPTAFCVGCLIVIPGVDLGVSGETKDILSTGFSRELPGNTHAEANALTKAYALSAVEIGGERLSIEDLLALSDVYTTLEPCSVRLSGLAPCADALVKAKIRRCFVGVAEPKDFVECEGQRKLTEAGIEVQEANYRVTATLEHLSYELALPSNDLPDLQAPSPSVPHPQVDEPLQARISSKEDAKMRESQDIESATVQLSPVLETTGLPGLPDSKERRYDRQLRLWAASGQSALESAHILVLGASPAATSILKNLVLPGIGAFTILDDGVVEGKDLGANFFLETESLGKNKAEEAIKFLGELNDSVAAHAETRSLESILDDDPTYLHKFSLIIAENIPQRILERVTALTWDPATADAVDPQTVSPPLIVVRTSGFLADFGIQLKEHPIITTHSDNAASLRIDKPFPSLLAHAFSLNFDKMDVTDHGHIPFVVILVRVLQEWKNDHAGKAPSTYAEKQEFKQRILKMKKKDDEENFDEAVAQAYKAWTNTVVPSEVDALFNDPSTKSLNANSDPFFHLVHALQIYTSQPPHTLPLSATLPDMKSDTKSYIHLQRLYKEQAAEDKARFTDILRGIEAGGAGTGSGSVALTMVDDFVKNAHALRLIRGKKWTGLADDVEALTLAREMAPSGVATHLSLCALYAFEGENGRLPKAGDEPDRAKMTAWVKARLTATGWAPEPEPEDSAMTGADEDEEALPREITLWEHVTNAIGEVSRAPAAELPTTAALMGGMVAQEVIKVITKQYIPIDGVCAVDLVSSTTGTVKV